MKMMERDSLMDINNYIWSPPDDMNEERLILNVRKKLFNNINDLNRMFWTRSPLNVAAHKMKFSLVRMMVGEAGINVNSVDEIKDCQRCALTAAISRAKSNPKDAEDMINLLVDELGADVNHVLEWKSQNSAGITREFTPLIWAIILNVPSIVRQLLSKGAAPEFRASCFGAKKYDWIFGTAVDIAKHLNCGKEDKTIIKVLEDEMERRFRKSNGLFLNKISIQSHSDKKTESDWRSIINSRKASEASLVNVASLELNEGSDLEELAAEFMDLKHRVASLEDKVTKKMDERGRKLSVMSQGSTSSSGSRSPTSDLG